MKEYKNLTTYNPKEIEQQWYTYWEEKGYFHEEVDTNKRAVQHCLTATKCNRSIAHGSCS